MNKNEFVIRAFTQENPESETERKRKDRTAFRTFMFLWLPIGAVCGFFGCLIGNSGGYFIPVTGIVSFVLAAGSGGWKENG